MHHSILLTIRTKEALRLTTKKIYHQKALIASSHNILKVIISLVQAILGVVTIYRTRGDQIQQYGYAAFGLTVTPYAFVSIANGLASLLTPDYPSMFLIRTPALTQAEQEQKGFFHAALDVELFNVEKAKNGMDLQGATQP